jgi:hypothetical protein
VTLFGPLHRLLPLASVALAAAACGTSFEAARLTEPAAALAGALRVDVQRVLLTDELMTDGIGDDTALVVELVITNGGPKPYTVSAVSLSCLMELDAGHPAETRSLTPGGGGEGPFPGQLAADDSTLRPLAVPPGQTRTYWALFRGYRFPGSDLPRRITLTVPGGDGGRHLQVTLADPARGLLRWEVPVARGAWMLGLQNSSLLGNHLKATGVSTQLSRLSRVGRLLLDVSLTSRVLVETDGALVSPTSSFTGIGISAQLTAPPFLGWGAWQDPRQLGLYAGGEAQLLIAMERQRAPGDTTPPTYYGALSAEAGLEVDFGARRFAATPFPLSPAGRALPRWLLRIGYTHWWAGHGATDGYTTSVRLSW